MATGQTAQTVSYSSYGNYDELMLHGKCPIHLLLKCIPQFEQIVQLYYRCKICQEAQVHAGVTTFLQHVRDIHGAFYRPQSAQQQQQQYSAESITLLLDPQTQPQATAEVDQSKYAYPTPPKRPRQDILQTAAQSVMESTSDQTVPVSHDTTDHMITDYTSEGTTHTTDSRTHVMASSTSHVTSDITVQVSQAGHGFDTAEIPEPWPSTTPGNQNVVKTSDTTTSSNKDVSIETDNSQPSASTQYQMLTEHALQTVDYPIGCMKAVADDQYSEDNTDTDTGTPEPAAVTSQGTTNVLDQAIRAAVGEPLDNIPKRGRVSNKMRPHLLVSTSTGAVEHPSPLHKGPLHHTGRVKETLEKCSESSPDDCMYIVLGEHYHCKACKAVLREEDLIAHRYIHSCMRLISDINIQQVVLNGEFCENIDCLMLNEGDSRIGSFKMHMHCGHCDKILETGHSFHQHLKSFHKEVWSACMTYNEGDTALEQCLICRGYFPNLEVLTKHMTDRHFSRYHIKEMQQYVIVCCDEELSQVEPYRLHTAVHHKTLDMTLFKPQHLPLKCLECGFEATGKQTMFKHQWHAHKQTENKICMTCSSVFGSLDKLRQHQFEKHKEKTISCGDCNKTFKTEDIYQKHFALVHSKNYAYFCNECSRGFQGEFQYVKHLKMRHVQMWETTVYRCQPGCNQGFVTQKNREKHQQVCLKYKTIKH